MDPTLTAILTALYQAHATIDALNQRVAELQREADEHDCRDYGAEERESESD